MLQGDVHETGFPFHGVLPYFNGRGGLEKGEI